MKIVIFLILHSSDLKLKIPTALGLTSAIKNSYNQRYSYQFPTFVQVLRNFLLTSLGKGWTNVHPDFQNGSKKIISHRFRVIQV